MRGRKDLVTIVNRGERVRDRELRVRDLGARVPVEAVIGFPRTVEEAVGDQKAARREVTILVAPGTAVDRTSRVVIALGRASVDGSYRVGTVADVRQHLRLGLIEEAV